LQAVWDEKLWDRDRERARLFQRSDILKVGLLAVLYVATAKLGIELSVAHGVITPVWVPTGLSLAALLLFGYRLWPGVAIGAFIANGTSDLSLVLAAAIAVGNTLEAVVGTYLLRRVGFDNSLERVRDVLALAILGAFAGTAVSATNGIGTLWLGGELAGTHLGSEWLLWWFGDAFGAILVAPALLAWLSPRRSKPSGHAAEGALLAAAITGASLVVFLGGNWKYPYVLFPLLVWAAIRFKQVGATTAVLIVGVIGTIGTVEGAVPIGGATATQSVQILQALIAVVGLAVLIIAATIAERDVARVKMNAAHKSLSDAQGIAHVGSWEWDIPADRVTWSEEMYRIYGYEPRSFEVTFEKAMERVLPRDQARVGKQVERSLESGRDQENPPIQYRIKWPDGTERTLVGMGKIKFSGDGQPEYMVGTVQDVTEVARASEELSEALKREREVADRLREIDQMKNTFMSAVSHDLRTPLTTIMGLADVLIKRFDGLQRSEIIDALSRMEASAGRASQVLLNLLDVDRVSRGAIEPVRSNVDLAGLAARAALSLDPAERLRVKHSGGEVHAWVDEGLVERVVDNLLHNAIRYTPKGSGITTRVIEQADGLVLCVDDSGPGVPDDMKMSIFEPFSGGGDAMRGMGTGVGLYLVARFAELHGGRAWVEDRSGGGASFRVFFPSRGEASPDEEADPSLHSDIPT
jgi:signal transduction histidine kinase/integral membrane sensor domain MASE1